MKKKQIFKNSPADMEKTKIVSQVPSKMQESQRVTPKIFKSYDHVSVIEQAVDSINSGDDMMEQFKNFGLETVILNDDSYDMKPKQRNKTYFNDATSRVSVKTSEPDNILDFSHMMRLKQTDSIKAGACAEKLSQTKIKLKDVNKLIKKQKQNFMDMRVQIQKQLATNKQEGQKLKDECGRAIRQRMNEFIRSQDQQKQKLRKEIKIVKQQLQVKERQCEQLINKAKKLQEQKQILKHEKQVVNSLNANNGSINGIFSSPKIREVQSIKPRRFNTETEEESKKQSQMYNALNKEVKQLQIDLQLLTEQNKNLKNIIKQQEKKIKLNDQNQASKSKTNSKTELNIEIYNKFLQKIKLLQQQINEMKIREKQFKDEQILEWKDQIKVQLQEIDQFLIVCEQREKKVLSREKNLEIWQKRLESMEIQLSRKEQELKSAQIYYQGLHEEKGFKYEKQKNSPRKTKIISLKTVPTPETNKISQISMVNEKMFRMSPPRQSNLQSYSSRQTMYSKPDLMEKMHHRGSSKYSDLINTRLNKIQSSIANQLYTLAHRN